MVLGEDAEVAVNLLPKRNKGFDFLPADRLEMRSGDGSVHLGDVSFRCRAGDAGEWRSYSTYARRRAVHRLSSTVATVSDDLAATLPMDCPLQVARSWETTGGQLRLTFRLSDPRHDAGGAWRAGHAHAVQQHHHRAATGGSPREVLFHGPVQSVKTPDICAWHS